MCQVEVIGIPDRSYVAKVFSVEIVGQNVLLNNAVVEWPSRNQIQHLTTEA